jgi:hypothetical protein
MAINYNVYLDGIKINDSVKDLDKLALAIIRESGFNNTEQIFRDDITTQLQFTGDGFKYIANKRKENACSQISLQIDALCNGQRTEKFATGIIKQSKIDLFVKKNIAKTNNIKDDSFSAYIRDYMNVEVDLSNIKTQNCFDIKINSFFINTPTTPDTYSNTDIKAFDCLEVFKYLVHYFTDNKVSVVSDYLTANKYAIATGYAMHNNTYFSNFIFPKVNIDTLYSELRKKLALYMSIEYFDNGDAYLRIEPESYFYSDEILFNIDELPLNSVEKIDESRLFNSIIVGSTINKLIDDGDPLVTMPEQKLVGWLKETKTNCGACSGEKFNDLDLNSNFIIDGNVVHESMNQPIAVDYEHDDEIFLLNYYFSGFNYKLVGNNTSIYNIALNNINTLTRWVGIASACIKTNDEEKYAFYIDDILPDEGLSNNFIVIEAGNTCGSRKKGFIDISLDYFDNYPSLSQTTTLTPPVSACPETNGIGYHYFTCNENGVYNFSSSLENFRQELGFGSQHAYDTTLELHILVYEDDTFTTQLDDRFSSISLADPVIDLGNIEITTGEINLVAGNIVFVYLKVNVPFSFEFEDFTYEYDKINFQSIPTECTILTDNLGLFKPFITELDYPICFEQYMSAKNNKKACIKLQGQQTWIKEIEYNPNRNSKLILIHKDSFYEC